VTFQLVVDGYKGYEILTGKHETTNKKKSVRAVKDWEARTKVSRYAAIGFTNWGKLVLAHVRILNGWRTDFVSRPFITT